MRREAGGVREEASAKLERAVIRARAARTPLLRELPPRRLEEVAEGHAGGAGRLAGAAAEAEVHMPREASASARSVPRPPRA